MRKNTARERFAHHLSNVSFHWRFNDVEVNLVTKRLQLLLKLNKLMLFSFLWQGITYKLLFA